MTSFGLPTLASTRLLQATVTDTKLRLEDVRVEAVTGRAANISEALDGDIARAQRLEKLIDDANAYDATIRFAQSEYSTVQLVLSNVTDGTTELAIAVEGAVELGDLVSIEARSREAESQLQTVFTQLNTSLGGRYLFGGAAVETPPLASVQTLITDIDAFITAGPDAATIIAQLDAYFETPGAGFDTAIYQGSTLPGPTREVAPGRRIGVEADARDQSIKDVIRGLVTISLAEGQPAAIRDALMLDGADKLSRGDRDVISLQNVLGGREEELQLLEASNSAQRFSYEQRFNALTERDEFEAATIMRNLETQLEASFLTASRIASLSLVNFLR